MSKSGGEEKSIADSPQASIVVLGKASPPVDVVGFSVVQDGNDIVMSWSPNTDVDLFGYEIREGDNWARGTVLVTNLQDNIWRTPVFSYGERRYMIKAIDTTGNYSNQEIAVVLEVTGTISIENLQNDDLDIFETDGTYPPEVTDSLVDSLGNPIQDSVLNDIITHVSGFELLTEVTDETVINNAGEIIADSNETMIAANYQEQPFLQSRFIDGAYVNQATYISKVVDLTAKLRARLTITNNIEGNANYTLYISTSDDNTAWSEFVSGEYLCRYFQIKVVVINNNSSKMFRLWNLKSKATIQFYEDGDQDHQVVSSEVISFNKDFYVKVRLYAIAEGAKYARITNKNLNNFTVEVRDDTTGNLTTGNVDWMAVGY